MKTKDTRTFLTEVRDMLNDLLATEGHDKFMRARLVVSLTMINAMIAAYNAGKVAHNNIRAASRRTKSR